MNFIDKVKVSVNAGKGGDGRVNFRQEKFVDKGGPDGGDGGRGGNVVLVASRNQNTLATFRYQKELKAEPGQPGGKNNRHGRSGNDLRVAVPVGTMVAVDGPGSALLADFIEDGQEVIIAKGGSGGFGNAHFISSTRQAPHFAEKGEAGDEFAAILELKMIADVGLIGLPNAGKSTLLARLSNARPEIADYPFTTLTPNLGVVDITKGASLLFADIPGLIEGAAAGKGLGHEFLRHVERTAVLVHLIDAYQDDLAGAYRTIQQELEAYSPELTARPQVVALNKVEGLDQEMSNDLLAQLAAVVPPGTPLHAISAASNQGVKALLYDVLRLVSEQRQIASAAAPAEDIPVLRLAGADRSWYIEKTGRGFIVTGQKIEHFARRTDFANEEAVERLRNIMQRLGITHELVRRGIEAGQTITISGSGTFEY